MSQNRTTTNLIGIEGGRAIRGAAVKSSFDAAASEVSDSVGNMAGYAIVAWDDEGVFSLQTLNGSRSPYATVTIPGFVADRVRASLDAE